MNRGRMHRSSHKSPRIKLNFYKSIVAMAKLTTRMDRVSFREVTGTIVCNLEFDSILREMFNYSDYIYISFTIKFLSLDSLDVNKNQMFD